MFATRRLALTVCVFVAAAAAAAYAQQANPFLGKWRVDFAYAPSAVVLEFFDDGNYTVSSPDSTEAKRFSYTLDTGNDTIDMGQFEVDQQLPSTVLRYVFDSTSTFHVYISEEQLTEYLQQSEPSADASEAVTEFTKHYREEITRQTAKAISQVPIGEGRRM